MMADDSGHERCQTPRAIIATFGPRLATVETNVATLQRTVQELSGRRAAGSSSRCEMEYALSIERGSNVQLLCQIVRANNLTVPPGLCDGTNNSRTATTQSESVTRASYPSRASPASTHAW